MAIEKCGDASCKVATWYSNQCVALSYGLYRKEYVWQVSTGLTQKKAEQSTLRDCNKTAKNCKVSFSECSLP